MGISVNLVTVQISLQSVLNKRYARIFRMAFANMVLVVIFHMNNSNNNNNSNKVKNFNEKPTTIILKINNSITKIQIYLQAMKSIKQKLN
jgi:hypothetical protein